MNPLQPDRSRRSGLCQFVLAASAVVALPRASVAGLSLETSNATVQYGIQRAQPSNDPNSAPIIIGNVLATPGQGYPTLTGFLPGLPTQSASGALAPFFYTPA